MVVPGNSDTAYHSSPRVSTEPGWWLSDTALVTTAVSPIMPETPFNIADSVSDLDSECSRLAATCSSPGTIRPPPVSGHPSRSDPAGSTGRPEPARPGTGPGYRGPWPPTRTDRPVSPLTARKTWRTVEPLHGMIYFAPEAAESYPASACARRPATSPRGRPPWGRWEPTRSSPPSSTSIPHWCGRPSPGRGRWRHPPSVLGPASRRPTPPCAGCSAMPSTRPRWPGPPTLARRAAERAATPLRGTAAVRRPCRAGVARRAPPGAVARPDPAARVPGRRPHRRAGPARPRPGGGPGPAPGLRRGARPFLRDTRGWPDADWDAGVARLVDRGLVEVPERGDDHGVRWP